MTTHLTASIPHISLPPLLPSTSPTQHNSDYYIVNNIESLGKVHMILQSSALVTFDAFWNQDNMLVLIMYQHKPVILSIL